MGRYFSFLLNKTIGKDPFKKESATSPIKPSAPIKKSQDDGMPIIAMAVAGIVGLIGIIAVCVVGASTISSLNTSSFGPSTIGLINLLPLVFCGAVILSVLYILFGATDFFGGMM